MNGVKIDIVGNKTRYKLRNNSKYKNKKPSMDELPFEMICMIAENINTGQDWKSWIFTCKCFSLMNSIIKVRKYSNHLTTLIKLFPDKPWNYNNLIENPKLNHSCCKKLDDLIDLKSKLKRNPDTWQAYLEQHDDFDLLNLTNYQDVPWEVFKNVLNKHPYSDPRCFFRWTELSKHPSVTWNIIQNNPELPWEETFMVANPNISLDIIQKLVEKSHIDCLILTNPSLTIEQIMSIPKCRKAMENMHEDSSSMYLYYYCQNSRITWKDLKKVKKSEKNMKSISLNPNITWDIVRGNINRPWDWSRLSSNTFTPNHWVRK